MFSEGIDDGQAEKDVTSDEELTSDDDAPRPEEGEGSGERVVKAKKAGHGTKGLTPNSLDFLIRTDVSILSVNPTSRAGLEQEYVFVEVISTFLRAIRAGAVHPLHSAILLAHYGRLGQAFDLCCKVVMDVLREEGMYKNNGDVVVSVVTRAIQEVGCASVNLSILTDPMIAVVWSLAGRNRQGRIAYDCVVKVDCFLLHHSRGTTFHCSAAGLRIRCSGTPGSVNVDRRSFGSVREQPK